MIVGSKLTNILRCQSMTINQVEHQAMLEIPPNMMLNNCCQRKRRRTTQPNPVFPSIHVHNHLPGSSACINTSYDAPEAPLSVSPTLPLTIAKRSPSTPPRKPSHLIQLHHQPIIDLTNSDNDSDKDLDDIKYPGIPAMLAELAREYQALGFLQYEHVLMDNGFAYINQLVEGQVRGQLEAVGIPVGVVNLLLSCAERLMRRTQKLKQNG